MSMRHRDRLLHHLRRVALQGLDEQRTDGQLLEHFISRRDETAFEALLRRHGPMVRGVCRRILGDVHDADDAFQATFLVLVRRAATVRPREAVGNFLYGVAYRTALEARRPMARRRAREMPLPNVPQPESESENRWQELRPLLDREINRLSEKYRLTVVLCELEGRSRKEVARRLEIPEGTLSSRLATARKKLAARLARYGLAVSATSLGALFAENTAPASVPAALAMATTKAAMLIAVGPAAGVVSTTVLTLTEGVLKAMFVAKLKTATVVLCGVAALGLGTGGVLYQTRAGAADPQSLDRSVRERPKRGINAGQEKDKWRQIAEEAQPREKKLQAEPEKLRLYSSAAPVGRVEAGSFYFGTKGPLSLLVQRKNEKDPWHRLKPGTRVSTTDQLVSLPGYASEVHLDSGVRLLLRGHVPEFSLFDEMNYLQESSVVLHKGKDVDADLTLHCGRLFISNHKENGPAVVRLRFNTEVWDLTLKEKGAEAVVDFYKRYNADVDYTKGEEPAATLHLFLLKGNAGLAAGYQHFPTLSAPPGLAYFAWNNKGRNAGLHGPIPQKEVPVFFRVVLPFDPNKTLNAEKIGAALEYLSTRMLKDKNPILFLQDLLQKDNDPNDFIRHRLAIYCLGALDAVNELLDVLGDTDPIHYRERDTAIFTLRRWLACEARNGTKLFDPSHSNSCIASRRA